ncbi:hypothetical protein DSO57_1025159 [Entomophthora muscae]|uniref:Uncharacterized protein n=1 Tax=Entomophthora muscae TaxID=34485 RepID=A0ACC2SFA9_9FUNG|nr:hypothetical protein DSO57_1025159 [Entomophthora muscae]
MPNRACDQCRTRKVRCVFTSNSSCDHCIKRQQPCTRHAPLQKRGPKNDSEPLLQNHPLPLPEAELMVMDEKLINYFMIHHNPNFGGILDESKLNRIQSRKPTPSETFLFFCICAVSAVVKMLGPTDRVSHYYLSHATNLTNLPEAYRDDLYYEALILLDFVTTSIENTQLNYLPPTDERSIVTWSPV